MAILSGGTLSADIATESIVAKNPNGDVISTYSFDTLSGYSVDALEGQTYVNNKRSYTDEAGVIWTQIQTDTTGSSLVGYQNTETTTNN